MMVHRCMVWFANGKPTAEVSLAYGSPPERQTIEEAMTDLLALKLTSMKANHPAGNFYATVVSYPKGHPPKTMRRELYLTMGEA